MTPEDETNGLLREIRDILAAQQGKYERNVADNRKMYEVQSAKIIRRQLIAAVVVAIGAGLIALGMQLR